MGYDVVHLGWHHGQVTLWGGQGRDVQPGDPIELTAQVHATTGAVDDYDVDLDGVTVCVRGGIVQSGVQNPAPVTLTSWGSPVKDAAPARTRAERHDDDVTEMTALFLAFDIDADPVKAVDDADDAESPAHCDLCRRVRRG